jgi:hypothetical protein
MTMYAEFYFFFAYIHQQPLGLTIIGQGAYALAICGVSLPREVLSIYLELRAPSTLQGAPR